MDRSHEVLAHALEPGIREPMNPTGAPGAKVSTWCYCAAERIEITDALTRLLNVPIFNLQAICVAVRILKH